jgi:hypothetical protein
MAAFYDNQPVLRQNLILSTSVDFLASVVIKTRFGK